MAKPATPSTPASGAGQGGGGGMDKLELKRLLKFARDEPVHMAFALGADGKALVVMDRRKPSRALEKQLKDEAPGSKNHRFGTAAVSADSPKLVRFTVNRAANGMARKLVATLKGTGYNKVEIGSEDGAAPERAESDEPEEAEAGASGAGAAARAGAGTREQGAAEGAAAGRPGAGSGAQIGGVGQAAGTQGDAASDAPTSTGRAPGAGSDAGAGAGDGGPAEGGPAPGHAGRSAGGAQAVADGVSSTLRRLASAGPVPAAALDAARRAQAAIKAGDVDAACGAAAELAGLAGGEETGSGAGGAAQQPTIGPERGAQSGNADASSASGTSPSDQGQQASAPSSADGAARSGPTAARLDKGCQAWEAVRANLESGVRAVMRSAAAEHGAETEMIAQAQAGVERVIASFDDSLSALLGRMGGNSDAASRAKLAEEARDVIARYRAYAENDPIVAHLDDNPYRPLTIRKTLDTALTTLGRLLE